MTLPATSRKAGPFIGNGVTTEFPFTFKVFSSGDIQVVRLTSGIESLLTLTSDYTVELNADQGVAPGGTVTLVAGALASGALLTIAGAVEYDQTLSLPPGGNFSPRALENALDRIDMQVQQLVEVDTRVFRLPLSVDVTEVSPALPMPEANKFVAWNSDATALQNIDAATIATIAVAGTAVDDLFTGTGAQTVFTLSQNPGSQANLDVTVGGVRQTPTTDYGWTEGTTLTFTSAPPAGVRVVVKYVRALPQGSADAAAVAITGHAGLMLSDYTPGYTLPASVDRTGAVSARTAIVTADAAAAAAGEPLILTRGTYLVDASYTFTAPVVMWPGAKIKTSSSSVYLVFSKGFESGLYYCLDTDGPTQFFKTEAIYPQWFGATGLFADDNTTYITRALRACRASTPSSTTPNGMPDATYSCATVRFTGSAVYRISGVPLYSGTTLEFVGEGGSINGTAISQISNLVPAFYVCPVNVSVTGTIINDSVGQNFITGGKYFSEIPASASEGEPIFAFLSPAQAYTQLGLVGTPGSVGHIDTAFRRVWGLNCNTFAKVTEGALYVHFEDGCQLDVCRRGAYYTGTSYGVAYFVGTKGYALTWGLYFNDSTDSTNQFGVVVEGGEFKAGAAGNATADYRRAININKPTVVAGSFASVVGAKFLTTTIGAVRHGGPLFFKNVERVYVDCEMYDADSTNDQKFIAVQDGVKHLTIKGRLVSKLLNSGGSVYTNSRMIQISQAAQTLTDIDIDVACVNEGAGTFASGVHGNFTTTDVDLTGTMFRGNFTEKVGTSIVRPLGWAWTGTAVYDPPNIAAGGVNSTTVTCTGAALGDMVAVSFSNDLGGLVLAGYVSAPSVVTCVFTNPTAGAINAASGTLTVAAQRKV